MNQNTIKLLKLTLKTIKYFFIVFITISIVFFSYFFFKWLNKESFIIFKEKYLTKKEKCLDLTLEDTKILNESFKNISYSWWIDYWCDLKALSFFQDKNKKITNNSIKIPHQVWKLKNIYEIALVDIKIDWALPKEIWNIKNLVSLEIHWTWIEKLPEEIENLEKLQILYIDKYLYKNLPQKIKEKIKNKEIIDYSYYIKDYYEN